jgi:hypothetical protein
MLATSIADPVVEHASNAGWFGPGSFTDHSNWDVAPVLMLGLVFVALHVWVRAHKALAGGKSSPQWQRLTAGALGPSVLRLVPLIFVAQITVLFLMETTEQQVVYGHVLGGALWLGGPLAISLAVHAIVCMLVALTSSHMVRALADATVQLVQLVLALATLPTLRAATSFLARTRDRAHPRVICILGGVGERAPPLLTA